MPAPLTFAPPTVAHAPLDEATLAGWANALFRDPPSFAPAAVPPPTATPPMAMAVPPAADAGGQSPATPPASPDVAAPAPTPATAYYFLSTDVEAGIPRPGTPATPELPPVPALEIAPGGFDAVSIRRDFPILAETVHGQRLVWLDNAATTQKPNAVIDRITGFYRHENSNVHRAAHALAARATEAYESARDTVRRFLNAPSARDVVFVRGATEAINLVAQSWGGRHVGPGDEIVVTWLEHHSNIVPWQQLAAAKGARLRAAPIDDRGQVRLDEYERLLGPRTRIVALTHVSNALGTVNPVREMVAAAHRHGALALVDGAQAVSHLPVDVQQLDADFYAFSGHKVYGPTGIGALYARNGLLDAMPPWQGGGNMIADVTFERTLYQAAPARFEAGTGSLADAVGLSAALEYVLRIGMATIQRHEQDLIEYATLLLPTVPGLRIIGTAAEKAGVISFVLAGKRSEDVGAALDRDGIAVRSGHHCAQPALRRFGLESSVRPSFALYNTRDDVNALVASLHRLQGGHSAFAHIPHPA